MKTLLLSLLAASAALAADANRLAYLDDSSPFWPTAQSPKFITPQWVGEPGVDGRPGKISQHKTDLALYDLEADVSESINVAAQNAEVVAKLTALAETAREDLGDTITKRQGSGIRPAGQRPPAK